MKNILFLSSLFLFLPSIINAQSVNDIPMKDIDVEFVQIVGTSRFMSLKLTINIDYGQPPMEESKVRDELGKKVIFNSMVDALNFMRKYGYEYKDAYALTVGNQNVYHFLLQRKRELDK